MNAFFVRTGFVWEDKIITYNNTIKPIYKKWNLQKEN